MRFLKGSQVGYSLFSSALGVLSVLLLSSCLPSTQTRIGKNWVAGITISPIYSELSVSTPQVVSGGAATVTLRLRDSHNVAYISTLPVVEFSASGGTSTGSIGAITNNFDGSYSANFTGITAGTATTLHATVNGQEISSALPTVQVVPSGPTFTVTPSGTNVTLNPSSVQTISSGSTLSIIVTPSTGYSVSPAVGGTCAAGSWSGSTYTTGAVIADCTVTFSATINTYTVTYNGNGNSGGTAPTDGSSPYNYNSTVTVLGNTGTLTKTGYTFSGWNTAANGSGTSYAAAATFFISANTTLYARWTINTYTVTYNGNTNTGGTAPTDGSSPYNYNSTVTVLGNTGTLTKTGYTFSGWNTAADGSGTSYAAAATFSISTDTTLYAQWTAIFNGTDNSNAAVGFGGGTKVGTVWSTNKLVLGSAGGCDGTAGNCALQSAPEIYELGSSWTPQWASLVSYWKMNNDWTDSKGTNPGTASGATFTTSARLGSHAGSFNGANNYVSVADSAGLSPTAEMTFSAWVSQAALGPCQPIAAKWTYFTQGTWSFATNCSDSTSLQVAIASSLNDVGNNHFETATGTWSMGWHHVAMVFLGSGSTDAERLQVYIDGVNQPLTISGSVASSLTDSTADLRLGTWENLGRYWNGSIDDAAFWSKALTASEVRSIYDHQSVKYAGTFTSRVINYGSSDVWASLNWLTTLPFGKGLPDGGASESSTDYSSLTGSTGSTSDNDLMSGIVGLWHLDETSGTTFKDSSGNGNDGTLTGGVTPGVFGNLGNAARFDGSSGYISASDAALPAGSSTRTISFWAKPTIVDGNYHIVIEYGTMVANQLVGIGYDSSNRWYISQDGMSLEAGAATSGVWQHVVAIFDGGTWSLYVNGTWASSGAMPTSTVLSALHFAYQPGYYYGGSLDEVAIWSRVLRADEILELYRRGNNRIKFQTRTCVASDCSDNPTWLGPDGSNQSYFSELQNNSAFSAAGLPTGNVLTGSPFMLFSSFTDFLSSFVTPAQYIQYRAIMESDDTGTACGGTWCSPELKSVTITP